MTRIADGAVVLGLAAAPWSIAAMEILLGVALVLALFELPAAWPRRPPPLTGPIAAFALTTIVAAWLSVDPDRAWLETRQLGLLLVFFLAWSRRRDVQRLDRSAVVWLGSAVAAAALGIGQSVVLGPGFRAVGTADHYMTYSGVMLTAALGTVGLAVLHPDRRFRRWALAGLAPVAVALLATQTRGVWLAFVVVTLALLAWARPRWLMAVPLVGILLWLAVPREIRDRAVSTFDRSNPTVVERSHMWRAGIAMISENPLNGVGPACVEQVYPQYRLDGDPRTRRLYHLHSNPVQLAAELGVPGLLAWTGIWVFWFRDALTRLRRSDGARRAWIAAALAIVCGFLISGLFEYNFGDTEVLLPVLAAMAIPYEGG